MNHINPDSEARRESARQTDGKFGTQEHAEPTGGLSALDPGNAVELAKYVEFPDGATYGPFADAAEVERFVVDNQLTWELHGFHVADAPKISPALTPERVILRVTRIDMSEARKRWERGLAVLTWDSRDFPLSDGDEMYSDVFKTRDQVDATDFDTAVGQTRATTQFGKPDVGDASMYDTFNQVDVRDIKPGDRLDVGAVGNWKVREIIGNDPDGPTVLRMNGPMGDGRDPMLWIVKDEQGRAIKADLVRGDSGETYADVTDSFTDGRITRREPQTDPNVIRERIAEQFPNATFGPDGTHTLYDGQIVQIPSEVPDDGHPINTRHNAKRAAIIEQAVVRWTPNTTASDLVRPA